MDSLLLTRSERVLCKDWLESEGVVLNAVEDCPADPYTAERVDRLTVKMAKTPSDFDKLRQFLEMDRKVLRFYCMLDDRDRLFGQFKKFILHVRRRSGF